MKKSYRTLFAEAAARTRKYGLEVPDVRYKPRRLLTEQFRQQFPTLLKEALGQGLTEDLACHCLSVHYGLRPNIARMLNSDVYLTLGWVRVEDGGGKESRLYEFDDAWIEKTLARNGPGRGERLHAWLTLPSMEMVDMSLISSVSGAPKRPEDLDGVLSHPADQLRDGVSYIPMLIGDDFLRRSGLLDEFLVLH